MKPGHLVLIGYRGTGKSTVARRLAEALAKPWSDADVEIASRAGKSIREIFAEQGEAAFRDLESDVLKDLLAGPASVISTGGGVILREENRRLLSTSGIVIWLRARPATIVARIKADEATAATRPALTPGGVSAEVEEMLRVRSPLYASCSQEIVDTDDESPNQVAAEIVMRLGRLLGDATPVGGEPA